MDKFHIWVKIMGLKLVQNYWSDIDIFVCIDYDVVSGIHEHSHFMRTTRLQNAVADLVNFSYTGTSVLGGPFQFAVWYNALLTIVQL